MTFAPCAGEFPPTYLEMVFAFGIVSPLDQACVRFENPVTQVNGVQNLCQEHIAVGHGGTDHASRISDLRTTTNHIDPELLLRWVFHSGRSRPLQVHRASCTATNLVSRIQHV